jgi:hypothetical protein
VRYRLGCGSGIEGKENSNEREEGASLLVGNRVVALRYGSTRKDVHGESAQWKTPLEGMVKNTVSGNRTRHQMQGHHLKSILKTLNGVLSCKGGLTGVGYGIIYRSSLLGTSRLAFHRSFNLLEKIPAALRISCSAELLQDLERVQALRFCVFKPALLIPNTSL